MEADMFAATSFAERSVGLNTVRYANVHVSQALRVPSSPLVSAVCLHGVCAVLANCWQVHDDGYRHISLPHAPLSAAQAWTLRAATVVRCPRLSGCHAPHAYWSALCARIKYSMPGLGTSLQAKECCNLNG